MDNLPFSKYTFGILSGQCHAFLTKQHNNFADVRSGCRTQVHPNIYNLHWSMLSAGVGQGSIHKRTNMWTCHLISQTITCTYLTCPFSLQAFNLAVGYTPLQLASDLTVTEASHIADSPLAITRRLVSFHYNNNNLPYILYHKLFQVFMNPNTTHTQYSLSISCGIRLCHRLLDIDFTTFATSVIHYIILLCRAYIQTFWIWNKTLLRCS